MQFIHRRWSAMCLVVAFLAGCGSTNTATTNPDSATLIAVNPSDFPALAACGKAAPASSTAGAASVENPAPVTAYVAELIDLSWSADTRLDLVSPERNDPNGEGFVVQASPATPCSKSVVFAQVSPLREYKVRVTTYVDPGGDPNRAGICTRNDTSVAVVDNQGDCNASSLLAAPIASFQCFGWLAHAGVVGSGGSAATGAAETAGAGETAVAGAGGSSGSPVSDAAVAGSPSNSGLDAIAAGGIPGTSAAPTQWQGRPAMAIEFRTVTLHYCL